jgi:hypothetical protein
MRCKVNHRNWNSQNWWWDSNSILRNCQSRDPNTRNIGMKALIEVISFKNSTCKAWEGRCGRGVWFCVFNKVPIKVVNLSTVDWSVATSSRRRRFSCSIASITFSWLTRVLHLQVDFGQKCRTTFKPGSLISDRTRCETQTLGNRTMNVEWCMWRKFCFDFDFQRTLGYQS